MYKNWVGKKIVSQYGLVCKVLDILETDNRQYLKCLSLYNNKVWYWLSGGVSLVTKENKMLDINSREIFGQVVNDRYELYPKDKLYIISEEEVKLEFS